MRRGLAGAVAAVVLGCMAAWLARAGMYGWTLFALLPGVMGAVAVWVLQPATGGWAALVGCTSGVLGLLMFLAVGAEGLICVLMSLPLVMLLGALGGWLAFRGQRSSALLLVLPPVSLGWDVTAAPEVYEVRTALEIAAPAERVWRHVVSFPALPAPENWMFKTGLAYPKRAWIDGEGVGAVRYCEFSTGAFVEPVEVWEPGRLLRFRVTESPAPMEEWSPYGRVEARHLDGYLVSRRGQFLLTPVGEGRTRLEGTTWYQHGLWPGRYWKWWADRVIHEIHGRVLGHIQRLAEGG